MSHGVLRSQNCSGPLVRHPEFSSRQLRDDLAVVLRRPAGADAALQQQTVLEPRVDADVDAVPVLDLLAVLVGQRVEVLGRPAELRRLDVAKPVERLAAAVGQPRVRRHGHAERREVGCRASPGCRSPGSSSRCAGSSRRRATTRGMSSCCTPAENSQFAWRWPKPVSRSLS